MGMHPHDPARGAKTPLHNAIMQYFGDDIYTTRFLESRTFGIYLHPLCLGQPNTECSQNWTGIGPIWGSNFLAMLLWACANLCS